MSSYRPSLSCVRLSIATAPRSLVAAAAVVAALPAAAQDDAASKKAAEEFKAKVKAAATNPEKVRLILDFAEVQPRGKDGAKAIGAFLAHEMVSVPPVATNSAMDNILLQRRPGTVGIGCRSLEPSGIAAKSRDGSRL